MKRLIAWSLLLLILAGCPFPPEDRPYIGPPFRVRVVNEQHQPLDSAVVMGMVDGQDFGHYEAYRTDDSGWVTLNGYARQYEIGILAQNYEPTRATPFNEHTYKLSPMPVQCRSIAPVEGDMFAFQDGGVISLSKTDGYRYYPISGEALLSPTRFPLPANAWLRIPLIVENSIWYVGSDSAIYRVDISNPSSPQVVASYRGVPIGGYFSFEAADDSLLLISGIVNDWLSVYEAVGDSLILRSKIPTNEWPTVRLMGSKLIMLNGDGWWGYDISDLRNPVLVSPHRTGKSEFAKFSGHYMALKVANDYNRHTYTYNLLDIRNPFNPVYQGQMKTPGSMTDMMGIDKAIATAEPWGFDEMMVSMYNYIERTPGQEEFVAQGFILGHPSAVRYPLVILRGVLCKFE